MRERLALLPIATILIWWLLRLSTTGLVTFERGLTLGVLSHFAFLIVCALTPVFKRESHSGFIDVFKAALRPAVLYALFAAMSTVCYHHVIQRESTALRLLERERFIGQHLESDEAYATLQEADPQLLGLTREEAKQRAMDSLGFQFNPIWHFTASLLLWVAAAMSTALFTSILNSWLRAWPS